jgi:hypothetical protein
VQVGAGPAVVLLHILYDSWSQKCHLESGSPDWTMSFSSKASSRKSSLEVQNAWQSNRESIDAAGGPLVVSKTESWI